MIYFSIVWVRGYGQPIQTRLLLQFRAAAPVGTGEVKSANFTSSAGHFADFCSSPMRSDDRVSLGVIPEHWPRRE